MHSVFSDSQHSASSEVEFIRRWTRREWIFCYQGTWIWRSRDYSGGRHFCVHLCSHRVYLWHYRCLNLIQTILSAHEMNLFYRPFSTGHCAQMGGPSSHCNANRPATYLIPNFIFRRFTPKRDGKQWETRILGSYCVAVARSSNEQNCIHALHYIININSFISLSMGFQNDSAIYLFWIWWVW